MTTISPGEFTFDSDGLTLFGRSWKPQGAPRAILAICHGLNSHSGQYEWVGRTLAEAGLAVYALDLRGRGRSEGERFFVQSVEEYTSDLGRLIDLAVAREGDLPLFLLGHSAGGVISSIFALDHQECLDGFICESFAFQIPAPDLALNLIRGLSHIAAHAPVFALKNRDFSRDPTIVAELDADPLTAGETQPAATVAALARADERLKRSFPQITLPVLILHGTADKATLPSGSAFFHETAGSADKTLKLYEGHFHDLLNDIGRDEVLADIATWIGARIAAPVAVAVAD